MLCFQLPLVGQCTSIKANRKIKNIITFQTSSEYCVVNCNTKRQLTQGMGLFEWLGYVDYLVLDPGAGKIRRGSLKPDSTSSTQLFECPLAKP